MYVCGPTVYQRAHIGTRARSWSDVARNWLRARLRRDARPQHHGHQRQDLRGCAGRKARKLAEEASRWYLEDTTDLGLGMPDYLPKATEMVPQIVRLIEELIERDSPTPSRVTCTSASRAIRITGGFGPEARPGRGAGAEPAQGGSARLRALEGEQAGRGHVVGVALGPRPARLAHRVLGDGREAARPGVRDPRRGARPRLPPPRERARAVGGAGASSPGSGCTTGCSSSPARRCPSRSGTSSRFARRSRVGARDAARPLPRGHWRKPIDFSEETLAARRRGRTVPRGFPEPLEAAGGRGSASPPRSTTTSTPRGARRMHGWRDHDLLRRALGVFGLASLAERMTLPRRWSIGPASGGARQRRLRGGRPPSRQIEAAGWEVRDVADGFRLVPHGDAELVYGRNAVREALRGPRAVRELWATERAL